LILFLFIAGACTVTQEQQSAEKITVIFDTDTNNELDDQHALAYLLFNGNTFDLAAVTVNATKSGGDIEQQYAEAFRVMKLCGFENDLPIYKGANGSFDSIQHHINDPTFDGYEAVNYIIDRTAKAGSRKVVVLAVGKLTNLALALKKDTALAERIRLVWLGSNYPDPGEYNQDNDTSAMNYVLRTKVPFEMVTVRYGKPSGSGAVTVLQEEARKNMPGVGPRIATPVTGRHGGTFTSFGDYSVNLFEHIDYHGDPPARSLFDMVAVAIVKNPAWGQKTEIPAPVLIDNQWRDQPTNTRKITVWENFDKKNILDDFYRTLKDYQLVEVKTVETKSEPKQ
jgi:hypothetical protein